MKRKAAERIAHASDIAVLQILALMQAPDTPSAVKLAAAKDLLDRAQVVGKMTVELEVKPWEELLLAGILVDVPEGAVMREFPPPDGSADPLPVEAERVDAAGELERYQAETGVHEYSHPEASGGDLPSTLPYAKRAASPRDREPAMPTARGDDGPPPRHPVPGPRRIEPDDDRPHVRRRINGDDEPLPPHYEPTYRPRRGRATRAR